MEMRLDQCTGLVRIKFAIEKKMEEWVSGSLRLLISHCCLCKTSVLLHNHLAYFIGYIKLNIFPILISFKIKKDLDLPGLSADYMRSRSILKQEADGKLVLAILSRSGKIDGFCGRLLFQIVTRSTRLPENSTVNCLIDYK